MLWETKNSDIQSNFFLDLTLSVGINNENTEDEFELINNLTLVALITSNILPSTIQSHKRPKRKQKRWLKIQIEKYKEYQSAEAGKSTFLVKKNNKIEPATTEQAKKIIISPIPPDKNQFRLIKFLLRVLKVSSCLRDVHLTNIIYSDLKKNSLSDSVKLVSSRTYSKDDGKNKKQETLCVVKIAIICFTL